MLDSVLKSIEDHINQHKRGKSDMWSECVESRLNKSMLSYVKELTESASFLSSKNEKTVLKMSSKR